MTKHNEYETPSQAIKCGQLLKKVAEIKEAKALEIADMTTAESSFQFSRLCHLQWSEISAVAHRNVAERKRNGVRYLPLTSDVLKLSQLLDSEADKFCKRLSDNCNDTEAYAGLSQSTLVKIMLFNRKRQGEVSKIKVTDWKKSEKADVDSDVSVSLSEFERGLLSVLQRMEIKGKKAALYL